MNNSENARTFLSLAMMTICLVVIFVFAPIGSRGTEVYQKNRNHNRHPRNSNTPPGKERAPELPTNQSNGNTNAARPPKPR